MIKLDSYAGVEFLHVELQIGLLFANAALSAYPYQRDETERRNRNARNARRAYDTFVKFRGRVILSASDESSLAGKEELLKTALRDLEGKFRSESGRTHAVQERRTPGDSQVMRTRD